MASEYKRFALSGWRAVKQTGRRMLQDWLPSQCSFCNVGLSEATLAENLCHRCAVELHAAQLDLRQRCTCCADTLPCPRCPAAAFPFDRTVAALPYQDTIRNHLLQLKFHGRTDLARAFSLALAWQWREEFAHGEADQADALIALPLTPERLAERGFNQSWLLAQAMRSQLREDGCACPPMRQWLVRRSLHGAPDLHFSQLSPTERAFYARGAFLASEQVKGRCIVLLDDVMTTGATMRAAAQALRDKGAAQILCIVLARA